jgi:uncharacterized phage protein gp47/JayE
MKTTEEIYGEIRAVFTAETGMELRQTDEMAVRLYAVAAQIAGLYLQNQWTLTQCFPQTAQGEFLERHGALRGVTRLSAGRASGVLRFSAAGAAAEALAIPAGTVCLTAGLVRFETTAQGHIPAGSLTADIPAQAAEPGTSGNAAAGTIRALSVAPVGVAGVTNPEPFAGGVESESDENLRARILDTYLRMPNGANAAYYEREALSFEGIVAVNVLPRARGRGTVDVVLAGNNGDPGAALRGAVLAHLNARREIAVDVQVLAPALVNVNLSLTLTLAPGAAAETVQAAATQALTAYFDGRRLGQPVLLAKLGQLLFGVPGVGNYHITAPGADVAVSPGQLPKLNSLQIGVTA